MHTKKTCFIVLVERSLKGFKGILQHRFWGKSSPRERA